MPHHSGGHSGARHVRSHSIPQHRGRSGRDNLFYLYEEPECFCDGIPCLCPEEVGSLDAGGNPKPNTLEKRSPLPAGHYWIDVFGMNIPTADRWFQAMSGLGVHVDSTEHFPDEEVSRVRNWYLFTYVPAGGVPVVWDKNLGWPTIAAASVKSSADTAQTPSLPLSPLDELGNWLNKLESELGGSIGGAAKLVPYAVLGGLGAAGYLLLKNSGLLRKGKNVRSKR